jgi:Tol biopolymer transport system component
LEALSVTAPPRPPRPGDPPTHDEFEALVEALIQEARQRARRRRRRYAAAATLVACVGVALFAVIDRGGTVTGSSAGSGRPSLAAGRADARIAYVALRRYLRHARGVTYVDDLVVLDADQGGRRVLARDAEPGGLAWSPDGRKLAFVGLRAGLPDVFVTNADGSGRRNLSHGDDYEADLAPAWSPDGQRIAFVRSASPQSDSQVYVVNADGSRMRRLASETAPALVVWSPDGSSLLVATFPGFPTVELYLVNADGSGQRKLTTIERLDGMPVWSPDGRRIAFSMHSAIYVINPDGSGLHRLTHHGTQPAWSPDGRTIAFASRHGKYSEIYLMNADGTNQRKLTSRGTHPLWSPDGARIAFRSSRDGNPEIYVMNADGTNQRRLTHDPLNDLQVAWSPAHNHQYATRR